MYDLTAFSDDATSYNLSSDIRVIATPGHTLTDVSVIVDNVDGFGRVVIAGDLFECEQDLVDDSLWREAGSEDPDKQTANRARIIELADFIVPGHGPMFQVRDSYKGIAKC